MTTEATPNRRQLARSAEWADEWEGPDRAGGPVMTLTIVACLDCAAPVATAQTYALCAACAEHWAALLTETLEGDRS